MAKKNVLQIITTLAILLAGGQQRVSAQSSDVTGYETVTVTISGVTAYDADKGPEMAKVKYNRQCALVITSDDMGTGEYLNNWALMNGYPLYGDWILGNDGKVNWGLCPRGVNALNAPYNATYMGSHSSDVDEYQPLTYIDDAGKIHRFTATSAIWPQSYDNNNYSLMQGTEAQIMIRTGWSFAQHDVNNITGTTEAEKTASILSRFQPLSELWEENVTGIGLKIMVEPNGDKNYIDATAQSDEMCWSIFQASNATHPAISNTLEAWTASLPITFSDKSKGSTTRTFPNADATKEQNFVTNAESAIASGSTNPIFYGCHGLNTYARQLLIDIATDDTYKNKVWVTSADEYWEYYNIYHNAQIGTPVYSNGTLTFTVDVPKYKKNQFRELTLNIPGLEGGTSCTITSADGTVTTGSFVQTGSDNGYVVNFGLETRILDYIDQLTTLYREGGGENLFVKRDAQYLIDLLLDGPVKTAKQTELNRDFNYSYTINAVLKDGTTTVSSSEIASGKSDTETTVTYAFPKYMLHDGTLYQSTANTTVPNYGGTLSVNQAQTTLNIEYNKTDITGVVMLAEGEDLDGIYAALTADYTLTDKNKGEYWGMATTSGAMAGVVYNGHTVEAATLQPGIYTVTTAVQDSYLSRTGGPYAFTMSVNGEEVGTFVNTSNKTMQEFPVSFTVYTADTPLTITNSSTSDKSSVIDYLYIQRTGDAEVVAPTVVLTTTADEEVEIGSEIVLTAKATLNGGASLKNLTFQYKVTDDTEWQNISQVATPENKQQYTATFSSETAADYLFRAIATTVKEDESELTGTSDELPISIVTELTVQEFILHVINKAGEEVLSETVSAATVESTSQDPLSTTLRSPYVAAYSYYNTLEEAQAATGTPTIWKQKNIYVGYTVNDLLKFDGTEAYTIYANNIYMHAVLNPGGSSTTANLWTMRTQKYDYNSGGNEVHVSTLPLIDDAYQWELVGGDPYNVKLCNKATQTYLYNTNSTEDSQGYGRVSLKADIDDASRYCLLYYDSNTAAEYVAMKLIRGDSEYVYMNAGGDNGTWRIDGSRRDEGKVYIQTLPAVNINVVDANGNVELSLPCHYMATATMPSFVPAFMKRAYTSGQAFYYDSQCTQAIADGAVFDTQKFDGADVYMTYSLTEDWNTSSLFLTSTDGENADYYILQTDGGYLQVGTGMKAARVQSEPTGIEGQWAFTGTPYRLQIINRSQPTMLLGTEATATAESDACLYAVGSTATTLWEMTTGLNNGSALPFIRLQGSMSGMTPHLYLTTQYNAKALQPFANGNAPIKTFTLKGSVATLDETATTYVPKARDNVTLTMNRPVSAGKWNTWCAPFALTSTQLESVFGSGTQVARFESATQESDNTYTLHFEYVDAMEAGVPYLLMPATAPAANYTIENVSLTEVEPQSVVSAPYTFTGTYAKYLMKGDGTERGFSNNSIVRVTAGGYMKGLRAFFSVTGNPQAKVAFFTSETTGISDSAGKQSPGNVVYNLSGQRLRTPKKGLNIINGKKIVIWK